MSNRGSILQVQEGQLIDRIDRAFSEVMDNINDVTYPHDKPRKLVITIEVKADSERKNIHMKADIKKVLPTKATMVTDLFNYQARDKAGNTVSILEENMGVPRGQIDINGNEINPTMIAYKVEEKKGLIEAKNEPTEAEVVKPLPEVNKEYDQLDEEKFKGNKIVL